MAPQAPIAAKEEQPDNSSRNLIDKAEPAAAEVAD